MPGTTIVLDHFGTPCGVGSYEGKMEDVMSEWKADMVRMSEFANVVVKIGGLAMPVNGFNWHNREMPPSSERLLMLIVNIIYTRSMLLGLQGVCLRVIFLSTSSLCLIRFTGTR